MMEPTSTPGLRRRWLLPLVFFQIYLSLTVWLFFYGPWPWSVDKPVELFLYLAAAQIAILVGYLLSWRRVNASRIGPAALRRHIDQGVIFLKVSLAVTILIALPTSLSRAGSAIPDVIGGLSNAGLVYTENFERLEAGNSYVVVEYLRMLLSPFLVAVFPLTVLYWGRMRWGLRAAALAAIAFNLSIYLATGTNKGIADVVVTLPWLVVLAAAIGTIRLRHMKLKMTLASLVLIALFLYFFSEGQQQRSGSGTEYSTFFTGIAVLQADSGNFISSLLPEELRVVYEALTRYVVHGYYALSLALQTDTPSTLGFGHSMFMARNADLVFGSDHFVAQSIPAILERDQGWGMFQLWHSIYPWLASDFGFGGTLIVIGLLAYLLGLSWGKSLTTASHRWVVLLYLLLVLFYYVPANNQIFQSGETYFAFFMVLAMLIWAPLQRPQSLRSKAKNLPNLWASGRIQPP